MAHVCKKQELGKLPFGVPETKIEWEGHPIPHPVTYTRQSQVVVYCRILWTRRHRQRLLERHCDLRTRSFGGRRDWQHC
jgi:hypothetical protein